MSEDHLSRYDHEDSMDILTQQHAEIPPHIVVTSVDIPLVQIENE